MKRTLILITLVFTTGLAGSLASEVLDNWKGLKVRMAHMEDGDEQAVVLDGYIDAEWINPEQPQTTGVWQIFRETPPVLPSKGLEIALDLGFIVMPETTYTQKFRLHGVFTPKQKGLFGGLPGTLFKITKIEIFPMDEKIRNQIDDEFLKQEMEKTKSERPIDSEKIPQEKQEANKPAQTDGDKPSN